MKGTLAYYGLVLRNKMCELFTDESGEVNIVAIVVLIGIAIILAVAFKKQIIDLLGSLFGTITNEASNAVKGN